MRFRILGPLEVLDGARSVRLGASKPRALLAVLLLHANEVVSIDAARRRALGRAPACHRGQARPGLRPRASQAARRRHPRHAGARLPAARRSRRARPARVPAPDRGGTLRSSRARGGAPPQRARTMARAAACGRRLRGLGPTRGRAAERAAPGHADRAARDRARARPPLPAGRRARAAGRRPSVPGALARTADARPLPLGAPGGGAAGLPGRSQGAERGARPGARPGATRSRDRHPPTGRGPWRAEAATTLQAAASVAAASSPRDDRGRAPPRYRPVRRHRRLDGTR